MSPQELEEHLKTVIRVSVCILDATRHREQALRLWMLRFGTGAEVQILSSSKKSKYLFIEINDDGGEGGFEPPSPFWGETA